MSKMTRFYIDGNPMDSIVWEEIIKKISSISPRVDSLFGCQSLYIFSPKEILKKGEKEWKKYPENEQAEVCIQIDVDSNNGLWIQSGIGIDCENERRLKCFSIILTSRDFLNNPALLEFNEEHSYFV